MATSPPGPLLSFGLVYLVWGLRGGLAQTGARATAHHHGKLYHRHSHCHQQEHLHLHAAREGQGRLAPWIVFVIFVLGPCEPLIPILMYPAAKSSLSRCTVGKPAYLCLVTVLTMLLAVSVSFYGLRKIRLPRMERFGHAFAGGTISACGASILFLGL